MMDAQTSLFQWVIVEVVWLHTVASLSFSQGFVMSHLSVGSTSLLLSVMGSAFFFSNNLVSSFVILRSNFDGSLLGEVGGSDVSEEGSKDQCIFHSVKIN